MSTQPQVSPLPNNNNQGSVLSHLPFGSNANSAEDTSPPLINVNNAQTLGSFPSTVQTATTISQQQSQQPPARTSPISAAQAPAAATSTTTSIVVNKQSSSSPSPPSSPPLDSQQGTVSSQSPPPSPPQPQNSSSSSPSSPPQQTLDANTDAASTFSTISSSSSSLSSSNPPNPTATTSTTSSSVTPASASNGQASEFAAADGAFHGTAINSSSSSSTPSPSGNTLSQGLSGTTSTGPNIFSPTGTGTVILAAVGSGLFAVILVTLFIYSRRRRDKTRAKGATGENPFKSGLNSSNSTNAGGSAVVYMDSPPSPIYTSQRSPLQKKPLPLSPRSGAAPLYAINTNVHSLNNINSNKIQSPRSTSISPRTYHISPMGTSVYNYYPAVAPMASPSNHHPQAVNMNMHPQSPSQYSSGGHSSPTLAQSPRSLQLQQTATTSSEYFDHRQQRGNTLMR